MFEVRRDQVHSDGQTGRMFTEASDLGLRAGEWPETIAVPMRGGGTLLFDRSHLAQVDVEGELIGYRYFGRDNVHDIMIYND